MMPPPRHRREMEGSVVLRPAPPVEARLVGEAAEAVAVHNLQAETASAPPAEEVDNHTHLLEVPGIL